MIVAIAYCGDDLPLMKRWANHVAKLGPYINHKLLLVGSPGVSPEGVIEPLRRVFGEAAFIERNACAREGWPQSCNESFQAAFWFNQNGGKDVSNGKVYPAWKEPFLWMEPDAIPLHTSWIDMIESEYRQCGKPFMGDLIKIQGLVPNGADHMSGIAVYPEAIHKLAPRCLLTNVFDRATGRPRDYAWDICGAEQILPKMARTSLIQHDFVVTGGEWRREVVTAECVRSGAVVYHPDKAGVLMQQISGKAAKTSTPKKKGGRPKGSKNVSKKV